MNAQAQGQNAGGQTTGGQNAGQRSLLALVSALAFRVGLDAFREHDCRVRLISLKAVFSA